MKKNKILLILSIFVLSVSFVTGCGSKENTNQNEEKNKTVATTLSETFKKEIKKQRNIEKVAKTLSENEVIVPAVQTFIVSEGDYLTGFKEEIKGYKKVVGISPMIGTIPFIAYIFEVEDTKKFVEVLEENAQLNWNICTQADEMKITIVDNYIFFIMAPTNFEE